jgi:hypothetical protein
MEILACYECTRPLIGPLLKTFLRIASHYHDLQKKGMPEVSLAFLRSTEGKTYSKQLRILEESGYIVTVDHGDVISIKPCGFDHAIPDYLVDMKAPVFCLKGHKHQSISGVTA